MHINRARNNPDYKETDLILQIRELDKLEDTYLNPLYMDNVHLEMCRTMSKMLPGKLKHVRNHAQDCYDYGLYLLSKKEDGSKSLKEYLAKLKEENVVDRMLALFEYDEDYSFKLFTSQLYVELCDAATLYSKDHEIRSFARRCFQTALNIRGRLLVHQQENNDPNALARRMKKK